MVDITESSGNVFADLGFDDEEAVNLKVRSQLMIEIKQYIQRKKLSQTTAAERMGVHQSLISDLSRGKIHRFTIDKLINMAAKAGLTVSLSIDDAA